MKKYLFNPPAVPGGTLDIFQRGLSKEIKNLIDPNH